MIKLTAKPPFWILFLQCVHCKKTHRYVPVASDVSADESEVSESVLRAFHPAGFLRDHACNIAPQFVPAQSVPI